MMVLEDNDTYDMESGRLESYGQVMDAIKEHEKPTNCVAKQFISTVEIYEKRRFN